MSGMTAADFRNRTFGFMNTTTGTSKPGTPLRASGRDVVAWTCFFLSGFITLTYEICWIRKGSLVFGAATPALSTVLAVFFGGMAIGSWLFGWYSQRARRPLVVYAVLEIILGLLAIASPFLFRAADVAFGMFYPAVLEQPGWLSFTRAGLLVLLLLPPTILMGGTLPLFCRHYVVRQDRIAKRVGLLYGCNTLGAAVGCAVCGLVLIPWIGVNVSLYAGGVLNILIGLLVWRLFRSPVAATDAPVPATSVSRSRPSKEPGRPSAPQASGPVRRGDLAVLMVLFFLSGLIVLASEVIWTRFLSLLIRNSVYTYTLTLTVILGGMVAGSVLTSWLFDRSRRRALIFGAIQVLMGLTVLGVLMLPAAWWGEGVATEGGTERWWVFVVVLLGPAVLAGIAFPLAIRMAVHSPAVAGIGVGRMTAINTIGGIVGALAAGFVALPWLGLHGSVLAVTGLSVAAGVAAWLFLERSLSPPQRVALCLAGVAAWLLIPALSATRLPADFLADREQLVAYREGIGSSLAVVRRGDVLVLEMDRLWQGESRVRHQIMAAHVPALLHPDPREVLVIGTGVGQTAGRFLFHDIERLDCVDIEPELLPLVRTHFESAWMGDPRVSFFTDDGRNYVAHAEAKYDLISIEVGQVFRPGVAGFYTRDFYEQARRRLKADGLVCQFVPVSFFTLDEFRTILQTFIHVFPESVLWYNTGELLLIGTNGARLQLEGDRLSRIIEDPVLHDDLRFAHWGGPDQWLNRPEAFLAGFLAGPEGLRCLAGDAPVYRDHRPWLEYVTARIRETEEIAIVEVLRACGEPVSSILEEPIMAVDAARVASLRETNLRDIVADAYKRPVEALRAQGRHVEEITHLRRALAWNPDNLELNLLLGEALIKLARFAEAEPHLETVVRLDAGHAKARYGLGHVLHQQGRFDEAAAQYTESIRLAPSNAEAHNGLGALFARGRQFDDAHAHFAEAVRLAPEYVEANHNLAQVLLATGRLEEAVDQYRATLQLRPDHPGARRGLALALSHLNRAQEGGQTR